MGKLLRVSLMSLSFAFLWSFVDYLVIGSYGFQALSITMGVIAGVLMATVWTRHLLSILEHRGEYRVSPLRTLVLLVVLAIGTVAGFRYLPEISLLSILDSRALFVGGYSLFPTAYATEGTILLIWEKMRGMHVISVGNWFPTLYAVNKNSAY